MKKIDHNSSKAGNKANYKDEDKVFDITYSIKRRIEILQNELEKRTLNLNSSIDGRLRCKADKSGFRYYKCIDSDDRNGMYLVNSKKPMAILLAQKEYDAKFIKQAQKEISCMEEFLERYSRFDLNGIYTSMHPARKILVNPFIRDDTEYAKEWLEVEYPPGYFPEGYEEYFTSNGLRVHSKSEILIAEMLDYYGVPYRYEYPIKLRNEEKRPDFTCLNIRTRKEYVWEHFGMMGNIGYATENVEKITKYMQNGYYPGENAIFSFAAGGNQIDSRTVKSLIERYLI